MDGRAGREGLTEDIRRHYDGLSAFYRLFSEDMAGVLQTLQTL